MSNIAIQTKKEFNLALSDYEDQLTEKQIRAIYLLAFGSSFSSVSKIIDQPVSVIKKWIANEPVFAEALQYATSMTTQWKNAQLQALNALARERLFEILSIPYEEASQTDKKEISKAIKTVMDIENNSSQGGIVVGNIGNQLNMTESSAELIARHLRSFDRDGDGIEIQPNFSLPTLNREYSCHPETDYGLINFDADSRLYQCHLCGKWVDDLFFHADEKHNIREEEYRNAFRLQKVS